MNNNEHVVFFDGICNLCNKTVDFLIRIDSKKRLRYASIQSEYAKKHLSDSENLESIVFLSENTEYKRSKAVLKILIRLGGFYKFIGLLFSIFPSFILDLFYNLIAKNRYNFFGKTETCRVPTTEEEKLFYE